MSSEISDCSAVNTSGIYQLLLPVSLYNFLLTSVYVYCDVGDNNAYTVVQSRGASGIDEFPNKNYFYEYTQSFGTPGVDTNFWFGLDNFYYRTYNTNYSYSLQIDLCCGANLVSSLRYDNFKVSGSKDGYILNATAKESQLGIDFPGLYDNLTDIGSKFSTYDDYKGLYPEEDCDVYNMYGLTYPPVGGWWMGSCTNNLNGYYYGVGDNIFYSNNTCQINTNLLTNDSVWRGTGIEMKTHAYPNYLDAHSYTRVRMALYRTDYGIPMNTQNFCTATPTSSTTRAQSHETTTAGQSQGTTTAGQSQGTTTAGQSQRTTTAGQSQGTTTAGQSQGTTTAGQSQRTTTAGQSQGTTTARALTEPEAMSAGTTGTTPDYGSSGLQNYQIALIILGGAVLFLIIVYICVRIYKKFKHHLSHQRPKNFQNLGARERKLQTRRNNESTPYKENPTISSYNENQDSFDSKTSSSDQTFCESQVTRKVASDNKKDFLHLDLNTLTNQGSSLELMKFIEDENTNYLIFPNIAKTYLFNMDELEYLGLEVTRHQVKKYRHLPTGIKLAIKYLPIPQGRYNGNSLTLKMVLREIENIRLLSTSPNVVDFYGLCLQEAQALLCMELMDLSLRDLYHIMHKEKKMGFPEKLVGYIFVKIVNALQFCKSKSVMHRDIKPSNILINYSGEIKLCDFGESRILDNSFASTNVGTILYWPPERFSYQYVKYDLRADVWSLGITLMEIIIGRLPYLPDNNEEQIVGCAIQQYIINKNFGEVIRSYIRPKYSESLYHILEMCTKILEERPKLDYLINSEFYVVNSLIGKEEIAIILKDFN